MPARSKVSIARAKAMKRLNELRTSGEVTAACFTTATSVTTTVSTTMMQAPTLVTFSTSSVSSAVPLSSTPKRTESQHQKVVSHTSIEKILRRPSCAESSSTELGERDLVTSVKRELSPVPFTSRGTPPISSTSTGETKMVVSQTSIRKILRRSSSTELEERDLVTIVKEELSPVPSTSQETHPIPSTSTGESKAKMVLTFDDLDANFSSYGSFSNFDSGSSGEDEAEESALPPITFIDHRNDLEIIPQENVRSFPTEFSSAEDLFSQLLPEDDKDDSDEEEYVGPKEKAEPSVSKATQRFKLMQEFANEFLEDEDDEVLLIEKKQLNKLIASQFICKDCEGNRISIEILSTKKFVQPMKAVCLNKECKKKGKVVQASRVHSLANTGTKKKRCFAANLRYALGVLCSGIGLTNSRIFLSYLGLPSIAHQTHHDFLQINAEFISEKAEEMKKHAGAVVKDYVQESYGQVMTDNGVNVAVSFDGSWMTRGDRSLYGVSFVIHVDTGLILDWHIASKFCQECVKNEKKMNADEFQVWKDTHERAGKCGVTYDLEKSSGGMEAEGAKVMFGRSMQRGLRYTTIVSDQDSSTFKTLSKANVYGDAHPIIKRHCLNHVSKSIYRKLDNARKEKRLGGVGKGSLTQDTANAFGNFYRVAIKRYHGDMDKIRKFIMASVLHHASTDENPMHIICRKAWCKYKTAFPNREIPSKGWHDENCKYSLKPDAAKAVIAVMREATSDSNLEMVSDKTRNINESVHQKLWNLVPKHRFCGFTHLRFAVSQIAISHNCGIAKASILYQHKMPIPKPLVKTFKILNQSTQVISPKKERKSVKRKRKERAGKDYAAGAFV